MPAAPILTQMNDDEALKILTSFMNSVVPPIDRGQSNRDKGLPTYYQD